LVGKEFGRGPQKKNKEITKSDPTSIGFFATELTVPLLFGEAVADSHRLALPFILINYQIA
jgi:hypothetical protein